MMKPAVNFKEFVGPFLDTIIEVDHPIRHVIRFNEPYYFPLNIQIWPRAFFHFCECGTWGIPR